MRGLRFFSVLIISVSISFLNASAQNVANDSAHYTPIPTPSANSNKASSSASKIHGPFFSIQAGTLIGCNSCDQGKDVTFSGAANYGLTLGSKARVGFGVGLDSYQNWQTMPMFLMASWDLIGNKNKNALFIQMAYGGAHPWFVRNGAYANYTSDPFSRISGGRMVNPQVGYRIKYYDMKLSFSIGYKFQRIFYSSNYSPYYGCPMCDFLTAPTPVSSTDITQDMSRVQLSMSVGWK
jgi:hypothetical protein